MIRFRKLFLWFAAGVISFFLAFFLYLAFLQTYILSKREFAFAALLWIAFTPLVYLLLSRFLLPRVHEYTPRARRNWLLLSAAVGILFALITRPPQLIFLLPKHTLQIVIPAGSIDRTVTLEYATSSLGGDISFAQLSTDGNWQRADSGFTYAGSEPASLAWSGRTGDSATVVFSNSPSLVDVQVGWDGYFSALDTTADPNGQVAISKTFSTPWLSSIGSRLIVGFTAAFFFLTITLFLAGVELKVAKPVQRKKGYWLLYALPMAAVWGVYLLTFFPGLMSQDSNVQWHQIVTGQFNDAHPVFHTLTMWLITRAWFSPAAVVVFQILSLSLVIAWGIMLLDEQGLPPWAAWGLVGFFSVSPINANLVITLWKDIPYSTCLLLMSLIILKVVFTDGQWLERKTTWIVLGIVSLFVASFRHNGFPIPVLTLPILALFYHPFWKSILFAGALFFGLYFLIHGPIYNFLSVDSNLGSKQQIFIHHIAAHVVTGGPLTQTENELARLIVPSGEWKYDCCSAVPTYQSPGYSESHNGEIAGNIQKLYLDLLLKEPFVDLQHQVCISSLVWEIPVRCGTVTFFPLDTNELANPDTRLINPNSLLPQLTYFLGGILFYMYSIPQFNALISPAIYLYMAILCTLFFSFRKNLLNAYLFLMPAIIQSSVLMVVNLSTQIRYQFGVYLIGLFSLGLLVLALSSPKSEARKMPGIDKD